MTSQQAKYEPLEENNSFSNNYTWVRLCLLLALCSASTILVFTTWDAIYRQSLNIPPKLANIPIGWYQRADIYSQYSHHSSNNNHNNNNNKQLLALNHVEKNITTNDSIQQSSIYVKQLDNERIYPSKLGNFIYNSPNNTNQKKLVCYYVTLTNQQNNFNNLQLTDIDPYLCTHINIGIINIVNNRLNITDEHKKVFLQTKFLKQQNRNIKILIWVGGADSISFAEMVLNHASRKIFIQSLKSVLELYRLDGIDLDWEFPSAYNKERQHFSQLLHEIRREYQREHRTYLLSIAVAAPEGIVYFAYDIREIQNYCDFVNVMTYDFHFFTSSTPFTGLNAPLYPRYSEHSILETLNINYSANNWYLNGLDKSKIIIGLPTYGHSFRLVNPFNNGIGSPAEDIGSVGTLGFVTYSEICWFQQNNLYVNTVYDMDTCSPYLYAGLEWISYEHEQSIECKTKYIVDNDFGGAMVFSLNTDDHAKYCKNNKATTTTKNKLQNNDNEAFPLARKIHSILFDKVLV